MSKYGRTPKTCAPYAASAERSQPPAGSRREPIFWACVIHVCSAVSGILASSELLQRYAVLRHIGPMAGMSSSSAVFFWTSVKIAYRALVAADVALMASSRAVSLFTS